MTDKQLIEHVNREDKIFPGFGVLDDFGVEFEENEYWWSGTYFSASSVEEAKEKWAEAGFHGADSMTYIGENDYYYSFQVEVSRSHLGKTYSHTERAIIYKESVFCITYDDKIGYSKRICALDTESVLAILDTEILLNDRQIVGDNVLYREMEESEDEYIYTYYWAARGIGDYGINVANVRLYKYEIRVSKITGEISSIKNAEKKSVCFNSETLEPVDYTPPAPYVYNSAEEVESMTDEQLIKHISRKNEGFYGLGVPDNLGVDFEPEEYWSLTFLSASSAEEAREILIETRKSQTICLTYIGENDYYYSFQYKQSYMDNLYGEMQLSSRTERFIVYKESVMFFIYNSQHDRGAIICALDKDSVLAIMDTRMFSSYNAMGGVSVIYREIEEFEDEYVYTYYWTDVNYGDWGWSDIYGFVTLNKNEVVISKVTGEVIGKNTEIKVVDFNQETMEPVYY